LEKELRADGGGGGMRTIVLSDHTTDELARRESERQGRYEAKVKEHEDKLRARQDKIDSAKTKRRAAWKQGKHLRATGYAALVAWNRCRKLIEAQFGVPSKEGAGVEDDIWRQGHEGEETLTEFLAQRLSDEWILMKGYHNPKGEVDQIIVGPDGIFAMEAKAYKGTIYCDGDRWTRDKYDAWGNQVLCDEPIIDKGGRSPARQVNEPADVLERFLKKTMPLCRICRSVIFTHEEAGFGDIRNITVDCAFLMSDWKLENMLEKSAFRLPTQGDVERAARLIERDHRYYAKRRTNRSVSDPSSSGLVPAT
jgi:hypothetical protein